MGMILIFVVLIEFICQSDHTHLNLSRLVTQIHEILVVFRIVLFYAVCSY